jgi:cytochrome P450
MRLHKCAHGTYSALTSVGWGDDMAVMPTGDEFRARRRLASRMLGPHALKSYSGVQSQAVDVFIRRIAQQEMNALEACSQWVLVSRL